MKKLLLNIKLISLQLLITITIASPNELKAETVTAFNCEWSTNSGTISQEPNFPGLFGILIPCKVAYTNAYVVSKLNFIIGGSNYINPSTRAKHGFVDWLFRGLLARESISGEQAFYVTNYLDNAIAKPLPRRTAYSTRLKQVVSNLRKLKHPHLNFLADNLLQQFSTRAPTQAELRLLLVRVLWQDNVHLNLLTDNMYQQFLYRQPTATERSALSFQLKNSVHEKQIFLQLINSAEYLNLHPHPIDFVYYFYINVLGTLPNQTQVNFWSEQISLRGINAVARDMLNSIDTWREIIKRSFQTLLNRAPRESELNYWTERVSTEQISLSTMLQTLMNTDEFYSVVFSMTRL